MGHAPPAPREHADATGDPGPPEVAPPPGDEARYCALFAATYDAVLRYVERRHHPLGAEDVVADVFLVAWRRLEDVPVPHDEARAWLCGVAQRTLADQRRGDARRRSLEVRVGEHLPTLLEAEGHDTAQRADDRVDLQRAWSRLSPTDQVAVGDAERAALTALPEAERTWFGLEDTGEVSAVDVWVADGPIVKTSVQGALYPQDRSEIEFTDFGADITIDVPTQESTPN